MFSVFLTNATDFAKQFNKAVDDSLAEKENVGIGGLRETVASDGASMIRLMITVGLIVATISLIFAGMKIASGNGRKRQEGKDKLVAVLIGAGAISGISAIIMIIQGIANNFLK
jgi:hypothetical protein